VATLLVSLVGQRFVPRSSPALLIGIVRQRFLLRGRSTSLVGLVGQCSLLRGHLVVMLLLGEQFLSQRQSVVGRLRHSAIPRHIALRYLGKELAGGRKAELGHVLKLGGMEGSLPTISLVGHGSKCLGVHVVLLTM
jgi:hypothetical protein